MGSLPLRVPQGWRASSITIGTYQLQGNRLIARADNGRQVTLAVEIVDGGKGMASCIR